MIKLEYHVDFLRFQYPFRIAHGERLGTDVVFVVMRMDDAIGFGEATLPPYLGVGVNDVMQALSRPGIKEALEYEVPEQWFQGLLSIIPDIMPALAALDMARWQIYLSQAECSLASLMDDSRELKTIPHTYTLGVSAEREMREKISQAQAYGFGLFKIKLDGNSDLERLKSYRRMSNAPFAIDANQAWNRIEQAFAVLDFLESEKCVLIEQPFHKYDRELSYLLAGKTSIPVIADEACCRMEDLDEVLQVFDGVNVKLQKCGGITPALMQLQATRSQQKKALIGCMSESSIGCNAAEHLTFLCDWADLDGPYLNANNAELCRKLGYSL
jgi:L-alanine-DL-glutamate epimerase-like enolase superfamily enzyme